MTDENKSTQNLIKEVESIDKLCQQIKDVEDSLTTPKAIDDLDVNVIDESLKNAVKSSDMSETVNDNSKEELQALFIDRLRKMPEGERNKILTNLAKLKQVNPNNRQFVSLPDQHKETLLKKLHEKRQGLEMRRKPKTQILKMRDEDSIGKQQMQQMMESIMANQTES